MKGKIFTASEATRMLPLVRRIATDAKASCRLIERHERALQPLRRQLAARLAEDPSTSPLNDEIRGEIADHEAKIEALKERREDCRKELEQLGAFLDDAYEGIVKFYGERDSRIIYLTWKLGEKVVSFWHETEDDHADRLPIDGDEKVANHEA